METKHTPEPWSTTDAGMVRAADDSGVAITSLISGNGPDIPARKATERANAERIVACVNGCEGLNPEAVRDMYSALVACVCAANEPAERVARREALAAIKKAKS